MNTFSSMTEQPQDTEPTPEQKRFQKFQDSAFGQFLSRTSESFDTSLTESYRPNTIKLTPIKIHKRARKVIKSSHFSSSAKLNLSLNITCKELEIYWTEVQTTRWNPETRQQATLTTIGNSIYLVGGISRDINQDVNVFSPFTRDWEKLKTSGINEPRFGHSAIEHRNQLVVFGGGTNFNSNHRLRECINGVRKLSIHPPQWVYVKTAGTYISARKGHAAAIIGKHLLVSGGLNDKQHVLHDTAIFNLQKLTWNSVDLAGLSFEGLAFHTAVSATSITNDESIYKFLDPRITNTGIYMFGGIDSKKQASNLLLRIIPGSKPLQLVIPKTTGTPPCPRFLHSMVYCSSFNYLLVFGGRVDVKHTTQYTCFNDVHIFDIDNLLWISTKVNGNVPRLRSGHCAAMMGTEMFIFGGVSNTCYCSSEMYKLEINPLVVGNLIKSDERRKAKNNMYRTRSLVPQSADFD